MAVVVRGRGLVPLVVASLLSFSTALAQTSAGAPSTAGAAPAAPAAPAAAAPAPAAVPPAPAAAPTAAGPASADPPEAVQAEYRDVVARAVAEFDAGRWAEARSLFLRAHELWPSARTYRTLGMTSFELRIYARALEELQAALDDPRRPLEAAQREEVSHLVERTRPFVGRYRVQLSPASAALLVDGAPRTLGPEGVLVLEVGSHELVARAADHSELRRRLEVQGREDEDVVLELVPEGGAPVSAAPAVSDPVAEDSATTSEDGGRLWTWIVGGTAIALGATSAGLWVASDSKYGEEYDRCHPAEGPSPCEDANDVDKSWQDLQTAHYVTLGFAIGAGVAAVALFFLEGEEEQAPSVAIGPGAVQVRARF